MADRLILPSTFGLIEKTAQVPYSVPTSDDWTKLRPEITKLYVCERRSLRYIIRYMQMKHGFKATPQMYKKRFPQWGIYKNTRNSARSPQSSSKTQSRRSSLSDSLSSVPTSPGFNADDGLMLTSLGGVRTWNSSFYESIHFKSEPDILTRQPWPENGHDVNLTFKLAQDALRRGYGELAGKAVRKAFLLAESFLTMPGPVSAWNMLEMMHYMVLSRHVQPFQLLLGQLNALVDSRLPKSHPLVFMLRALRTFSAKWVGSEAAFKDDSAALTPSSSLDTKDQTIEAREALLSLIERLWTLNAEILFQNFDQRLFQLYVRVHWNLCSITPPAVIAKVMKQWLAHTSLQQVSNITVKADQDTNLIEITSLEKDTFLQGLFATPLHAAPLMNIESVFRNSITALREYASLALTDTRVTDDTNTLLRVLAVLVTSQIMVRRGLASRQYNNEERGTILRVTTGQAGALACAIRTLLDINIDNKHCGASTNLVDTVEQIRFIIALQDYADTKVRPEVIQEMWLLEDALVAAGRYEEAQETRREVHRRLDCYLRDITSDPV